MQSTATPGSIMITANMTFPSNTNTSTNTTTIATTATTTSSTTSGQPGQVLALDGVSGLYGPFKHTPSAKVVSLHLLNSSQPLIQLLNRTSKLLLKNLVRSWANIYRWAASGVHMLCEQGCRHGGAAGSSIQCQNALHITSPQGNEDMGPHCLRLLRRALPELPEQVLEGLASTPLPTPNASATPVFSALPLWAVGMPARCGACHIMSAPTPLLP